MKSFYSPATPNPLLELLFVGIKTMNISFNLGRRTSDLESKSSLVGSFLQFLNRFDTHVLKSMLESLKDGGNQDLDRSLVFHASTDSLCHFDGFALGKISLVSSFLHGF